MKVDELVKEYENNEYYDFTSHILENIYIPIEKKQAVCQYIVQNSYYTLKDGERLFQANTTKLYVLTALGLVDLYTDIERDENDVLGDFNKLNEIGFLAFLEDELDDHHNHEYEEFQLVLNAEKEDLLTNEYEPHGFIRHQAERFGNLIGATLYPVIKDLDVDKLGNMIKGFVQKEEA